MENNDKRSNVTKKKRIKSTVIILAGLTSGIGLYLAGSRQGYKTGAVEGHRVGYIQGVNDVASIVKEVKSEILEE